MKRMFVFVAITGLLVMLASMAQANLVTNGSFEEVNLPDVGGESFTSLIEWFDAQENVADGDPALPLDGTLASPGTGQPTGGWDPLGWDTSGTNSGDGVAVDARWPNWWTAVAGPTDGTTAVILDNRTPWSNPTHNWLKQEIGTVEDLLAMGSQLEMQFDARYQGAGVDIKATDYFEAYFEVGGTKDTADAFYTLFDDTRLIHNFDEIGTEIPPGMKADPGESVSVGPENMETFTVTLDLTQYEGNLTDPVKVIFYNFREADATDPVTGRVTDPSDSSRVYLDNVRVEAVSVAIEWDGGIGNWSDSNWSGGDVAAGMDMIINADTEDSDVTVAADFIDDGGNGTGPAMSVFVGEEFASKLTVASGVTLEVNGDTTAGEFGKIAVESGAVLQTGSATIEIDGRLIAGVQGVDSGLVQSAGQLTIEDADAIQVDWLPGADATSMFGGEYTIAEYTGTALATTGTTANADANIGVGYIKSVAYDVDLGAGVLGVNVELQPQGLGDTDLDADVDGDDLATFGLSWAPSGTDKTWFDGDFDFDGDIDGDDLAALGLAWAPSGISFPAGDIEVTAVPEPGSIVMLLIGAAGLLIYRKRR